MRKILLDNRGENYFQKLSFVLIFVILLGLVVSATEDLIVENSGEDEIVADAVEDSVSEESVIEETENDISLEENSVAEEINEEIISEETILEEIVVDEPGDEEENSSQIIVEDTIVEENTENIVNESGEETIFNNESIVEELAVEEENSEISNDLNETISEQPLDEEIFEGPTAIDNSNPNLDIEFSFPEKIIRGESFEVIAFIENEGAVSENIGAEWMIPDNFEIDVGNISFDCGIVNVGGFCSAKINLIPLSTIDLGNNEIGLEVFTK